jgi:hypothetical protein
LAGGGFCVSSRSGDGTFLNHPFSISPLSMISIRSPALLVRLKGLWFELRDDILQAQTQYQPEKKPWGARFDRGR